MKSKEESNWGEPNICFLLFFFKLYKKNLTPIINTLLPHWPSSVSGSQSMVNTSNKSHNLFEKVLKKN
jgi:hypothetical protein